MCVFYCTSLGVAVSALYALLSSHTHLCPCNCLYLFYDKVNDDDDDDDDIASPRVYPVSLYAVFFCYSGEMDVYM